MAEGIANHLGLDYIYALESAGVESHGLNPLAVKVMAEIEIDISHHQSKSILTNDLYNFDIIITLCGDARDRCPVLTEDCHYIHWSLEDPAKAIGPDDVVIETYRKVRDQIYNNVKSLK